jgi:hypothetical protein
MTDRELLEAAAKAEGHGVEFDAVSGLTFLDTKFTGVLWNPLHNDGDALRLAVKLGLYIMQQPDCAEPWVDICGPDVEVEELYGTDPYAATRRAIVRASAEIGRSMK